MGAFSYCPATDSAVRRVRDSRRRRSRASPRRGRCAQRSGHLGSGHSVARIGVGQLAVSPARSAWAGSGGLARRGDDDAVGGRLGLRLRADHRRCLASTGRTLGRPACSRYRRHWRAAGASGHRDALLPGALAAPLALLAVGLLLLGAALYATRHRLREINRRRFPYQVGSKAAALAIATAAAVTATFAALLVGI